MRTFRNCITQAVTKVQDLEVKSMKRLIISNLFLFLMIIPFTAYSTPIISGISGTISNGSGITISGSSFGTKTTAAPSLWDTVDNKYSLSNGAVIPAGGSYPWGWQQGTTYDTIDSQRGSYGKVMYKSSDGHVDYHKVSPVGNLYVSWWLKMSANPIPPAGNHSSKFIRCGNSAYEGNPNVETFSWTQQQSYVYDQGAPNSGYLTDDWLDNGQTDWAINPNTWNFLEVWFDNTAKTYTIKVDGNTKVDASSWAGDPKPFNFDEVWLIGFDAGGNAPPTLNLWTDDIYIDNTFSRVMIGDQNTYTTSTHFEMQIPSAWNSNGQSITITLNQGSFANNSTAYLYVFDSTGAVNSSGYPISYGSGGVTPVNGSSGSDNVATISSLSSTAPVINTFVISPTSSSLTVPIVSFTATNASKYCVSTTNSSSGCTWTTAAPTSVTFTSARTDTAYAFVKNSTGTISSSVSSSSDVTLPTNPPVNGVCGSDDGETFSSLSSDDPNLCLDGTISSFRKSNSSYTWKCKGTNGGSNISCSASIKHRRN